MWADVKENHSPRQPSTMNINASKLHSTKYSIVSKHIKSKFVLFTPSAQKQVRNKTNLHIAAHNITKYLVGIKKPMRV